METPRTAKKLERQDHNKILANLGEIQKLKAKLESKKLKLKTEDRVNMLKQIAAKNIELAGIVGGPAHHVQAGWNLQQAAELMTKRQKNPQQGDEITKLQLSAADLYRKAIKAADDERLKEHYTKIADSLEKKAKSGEASKGWIIIKGKWRRQ